MCLFFSYFYSHLKNMALVKVVSKWDIFSVSNYLWYLVLFQYLNIKVFLKLLIKQILYRLKQTCDSNQSVFFSKTFAVSL